jgi:hypothetical protein
MMRGGGRGTAPASTGNALQVLDVAFQDWGRPTADRKPLFDPRHQETGNNIAGVRDEARPLPPDLLR